MGTPEPWGISRRWHPLRAARQRKHCHPVAAEGKSLVDRPADFTSLRSAVQSCPQQDQKACTLVIGEGQKIAARHMFSPFPCYPDKRTGCTQILQTQGMDINNYLCHTNQYSREKVKLLELYRMCKSYIHKTAHHWKTQGTAEMQWGHDSQHHVLSVACCILAGLLRHPPWCFWVRGVGVHLLQLEQNV